MKKIIALLLIFSLLLTLAACGENAGEQLKGDSTNQTENYNDATNTQTPNADKGEDGSASNNNSQGELQNNGGNSQSEPQNPSGSQNSEEPDKSDSNTSQSEPSENPSNEPSDSGNQVEPQGPSIDLTGVGSVICFGDSITEGMNVGDDYSYPSILQKNLGNQITVYNGGVSGETSTTIMSRANAIDFTLTNDVTFAAGQKKVELSAKLFTTTAGEEIYYRYGKLGNGLAATKVKIDGKAYTLSVTHGSVESEHKYIIERSDAAKALTLKKGVKVEFDYSEYFEKRYCTIVLMGANDDDLTAEQLIARYKEIAKTSKYFIAIIPHYGADYSAEFEKAFPNATVNLREYCKNDVWQDYNFTKTAKDEYFMSTGNVAAQFVLNAKKGDCHLSAKGYKVLGDLIYKKGVEMGIWN